jgi:hypothetical protein
MGLKSPYNTSVDTNTASAVRMSLNSLCGYLRERGGEELSLNMSLELCCPHDISAMIHSHVRCYLMVAVEHKERYVFE